MVVILATKSRWIVLDDAYVTGTTQSGDFPTVNFFDNTLGGAEDAFVSKFDPSLSGGASLLYSTYLGGSGSDFGNEIAVDSSEQCICDWYNPDSGDFPTTVNFVSTDLLVGCPGCLCDQVRPVTFRRGLGLDSTPPTLGVVCDDFGNGIAVDTSNNAHT